MFGENKSMSETGGVCLAVGTILLAGALVFHGPPDANLAVQMEHIANGEGRWATVHWIAAAALFLISAASFLKLAGDDEVRRSPLLGFAWVVMALGALTTFSTAIAEASVIAVAAERGDTDGFMTWWAFAAGMGNGFWALALAAAIVAYSDASRTAGNLPRAASLAGVAFGVFSAVGWTLGEQLGIGIGGPIWLVSSLLMCGWLAWYGLGSRAGSPEVSSAHGV